MPSTEDTRLLNTAPSDTRFIYVHGIDEMNELAALGADDLEILVDKWHGRSKAC